MTGAPVCRAAAGAWLRYHRRVIRASVLRRYLQVCYGRGASAAQSDPEAFRGASWDEYLALMRLAYPGITAKNAARMAWTRPDLAARAEALPDEPPAVNPDPTPWAGSWVEKRAKVDLRRVPGPGKDGAALVIVRVNAVSGWQGLRAMAGLKRLVVHGCGTAETAAVRPRVRLLDVDLEDSAPAAVEVVLASTTTERLSLVGKPGVAIELAPLAGHRRLRRALIAGAEVRGVRALRGLPLEELTLGNVAIDDELVETMASWAPTLRSLRLATPTAIGPDRLPLGRLGALERLAISGHPAHRAAWIDLALARPELACDFTAPPAPPGPVTTSEVAEVYRGVELFRVDEPRKKPRFELADDLAGELALAGDNGDLEDVLRPRARKAGKKLTWSSEADTLVAWAADVATLRWLIDEARDRVAAPPAKPRRSVKRPPPRSRPPQP